MKRYTIVGLLVGALALPAAAQAQSSGDGYGAVAGVESGTVQNGVAATPAQVASTESGSLPFTGAEVGLTAGAGLLLVGAGFGLRRLQANK